MEPSACRRMASMMIRPHWEKSALVSWVSQRRSSSLLAPASWVPMRCPRIPFCYSEAQKSPSSTSTENLKGQLEALHLEAEQARARANAARARFMRLTESIENLRKRAIVDLKSGKEESARQLIAEKQKVMQALEKSKQRAELLEELCNKLGEAISSKEVQLIAALSSATMGVNGSNNTKSSVRIVSPKAADFVSDQTGEVKESEDSVSTDEDNQRFNDQDMEALTSGAAEVDALKMDRNNDDAVNAMLSTRPDMYLDFLSKIDSHLHEMEVQLHSFLNIAAMVLADDVSLKTNEKAALVKQIWHDVLSARARIGEVVRQEDFG